MLALTNGEGPSRGGDQDLNFPGIIIIYEGWENGNTLEGCRGSPQYEIVSIGGWGSKDSSRKGLHTLVRCQYCIGGGTEVQSCASWGGTAKGYGRD